VLVDELQAALLLIDDAACPLLQHRATGLLRRLRQRVADIGSDAIH
jgi:hypothetical protein